MVNQGNYLEVIQRILARQQKIKFAFGFLFLLLALLLYATKSQNSSSWLLVLIAILFLAGFTLLFTLIRNFQYYKNPVYRTFKYELKEIVWVHHQITQVIPFGIHMYDQYTLFVYLLSGDNYQILGSKKEIMFLVKELPTILPHASFGHSVQKEQLFIANPALLIRHD